MTLVRGIRGATTADENSQDAILEATTDLLRRMVEANDVQLEDIAAIYFTATEDLDAEFPPVAARRMGWKHLALLTSKEMSALDGQPRCIRVLMLVNTVKTQEDIRFVYLKDAINLRKRGMEEEV